MERKIPFQTGENYHLYTRGVEKRIVFTSEHDSNRFLSLLFHANNDARMRLSEAIRSTQGEPLQSDSDERDVLVDILAYTLMPNHIHLLVREKGWAAYRSSC